MTYRKLGTLLFLLNLFLEAAYVLTKVDSALFWTKTFNLPKCVQKKEHFISFHSKEEESNSIQFV